MTISYWKQLGATRPVNARGPATPSTDVGTYGAFNKQQIPGIACINNGTQKAWFLSNYGGILPWSEESGEDAGCYARLMRSTSPYFGDAMEWDPVKFWLPVDFSVDTAQSVQQPMVSAIGNNRLLIAYINRGAGGYNRSIWATILENPLAEDPADFVFSRDVFIGVGFVSPLRYINGVLYYCAYEAPIGESPPYLPYQGNKWTRLQFNDSIPVPVQLSYVSDAVPEAELMDYEEPSTVAINGNPRHLRQIFRVQQPDPGVSVGQYTSDSLDGGDTWQAAVPFTLVNTVSSRVDWINLPNGLIALAYNDSLTKRETMTLAILSADASIVIGKVVIDARGAAAPHPSYPNLALDPYDLEHVYCAWDCGRGNQNPPTDTNEILFARINIAAAMQSILQMQVKVFNS